MEAIIVNWEDVYSSILKEGMFKNEYVSKLLTFDYPDKLDFIEFLTNRMATESIETDLTDKQIYTSLLAKHAAENGDFSSFLFSIVNTDEFEEDFMEEYNAIIGAMESTRNITTYDDTEIFIDSQESLSGPTHIDFQQAWDISSTAPAVTINYGNELESPTDEAEAIDLLAHIFDNLGQDDMDYVEALDMLASYIIPNIDSVKNAVKSYVKSGNPGSNDITLLNAAGNDTLKLYDGGKVTILRTPLDGVRYRTYAVIRHNPAVAEVVFETKTYAQIYADFGIDMDLYK